MAFISTVSGVSLVDTDRLLHVVSYDDETNDEPRVVTYDLKNKEAKNFLSVQKIRELMAALAATGKLTMTADAYAYLRFESERFAWPGDGPLVTDEQVSLVFPAQGNKEIHRAPKNQSNTDTICRWAAAYYYQLNHAQVKRWDGVTTKFEHRAANTLSFRCYAPYQNVKRENRQMMGPTTKDSSVLQFDWSAAEWNLILQHCGYSVPQEDAYAAIVSNGVSRETAKMIVLPHIYGSGRQALIDAHGSNNVEQVIQAITHQYPNVMAWRDYISNYRYAEFQGFILDLGEQSHKRLNHWAQTALQLCKWELLSRVAQQGGHALAAGDLHDQLIWHVSPQDESKAHSIVQQVRSPMFGKYSIPPKLTADACWR